MFSDFHDLDANTDYSWFLIIEGEIRKKVVPCLHVPKSLLLQTKGIGESSVFIPAGPVPPGAGFGFGGRGGEALAETLLGDLLLCKDKASGGDKKKQGEQKGVFFHG